MSLSHVFAYVVAVRVFAEATL